MLRRLIRLISTATTVTTPMASRVIPTTPTALISYEEISKLQLPSTGNELSVAIFGHGCFWGTQQVFEKYYGKKHGVIKTSVGYTGGTETTKQPTYQDVSRGSTNHAESLRIEYDPKLVGYAELVEFFYRTHDPTTRNRQGHDVGTQYRSAIFTSTPEQERIARQVTEEVQKKHFDPKNAKIVTSIEPATLWYDAEEYHQYYLDKNPWGYHCSTHVLHW